PATCQRRGDPLHRAERVARDRRAGVLAGRVDRSRIGARARAAYGPARWPAHGAAGAVVEARGGARGTMKLLLGVDEGTSAVKAVLYDTDLRPVAEARREKPLSHPQPGWVEQDPEDVLEAVVGAIGSVLRDAPGEIVACG